jgi:tetratricopeptide (TPR) repeat protein
VLLSPWDEQAPVPPWDDEVHNFVRVVVVEPGVRQALASGSFLQSVTERMEGRVARAAAAGVREGGEAAAAALRDSVRAQVAAEVGLSVAALDSAIRTWRPDSAYQRGLAALYREDYPAATQSLEQALETREASLARAEADVYDAAFFLGKALYAQKRYQEAASAYWRAWQLRPSDPTVMNNLAVALLEKRELLGRDDPMSPDTLLVQALLIAARPEARDHQFVATMLSNLALARLRHGDLVTADTLLVRAIATDVYDRAVAYPASAARLSTLAIIRELRGDSASADSLDAQARSIEALASRSGATAPPRPMEQRAVVHFNSGDLAETILTTALSARAPGTGPDDSTVAVQVAAHLSHLAQMRERRGDLTAAGQLYARVITIFERARGPNDPNVQATRERLAALRLREAGSVPRPR